MYLSFVLITPFTLTLPSLLPHFTAVRSHTDTLSLTGLIIPYNSVFASLETLIVLVRIGDQILLCKYINSVLCFFPSFFFSFFFFLLPEKCTGSYPTFSHLRFLSCIIANTRPRVHCHYCTLHLCSGSADQRVFFLWSLGSRQCYVLPSRQQSLVSCPCKSY